MNKITFSDGEWTLMNLLWDKSPLTIGYMVDALMSETGWSKATINIMLNRLAEKGAVKIDASGRAKEFYPLTDRVDAVREEASRTLKKVKTGGIGLMLSAMVKETKLTDDEIEELYRILKEGREND